MSHQEDAVSVKDGLDSMKTCDHSIAEIDALIGRLLKMKEQLSAQKDYCELAIHEGTKNKGTMKLEDKLIDPRVKRWKHTGRVREIGTGSTDENDKIDNQVIDVGKVSTTDKRSINRKTEAGDNLDIEPIRKTFGGKTKDIFNTGQRINNLDGLSTTDTKEAEGSNIQDIHKFLIGVNGLITHKNDNSTIDDDNMYTEAIIPDDSGSVSNSGLEPKDKEAVNAATKNYGDISEHYKAGGKHRLNNEIIMSLIGAGGSSDEYRKDTAENSITIDDESITIDRVKEDTQHDYIQNQQKISNNNTKAKRKYTRGRYKGVGL